MSRPTLYLFVGYPGAGKTTTARLIHELTGAEHLWADHIRHQMFGRQPTHSAAESHQLYEHLNQLTGQLLAAGKSVIFDTNFNYFKDRQKLREIAAEHGAAVRVVWLTTDRNLAKRRATEAAAGQATRIWGDMPSADFDRISGNLQPPTPEEHAIRLEGVGLTPERVKAALGL